MSVPTPITFTLDQAKAAIKDVISAFYTPENLDRMNAARQQAGDDFMKIMQFVLPVAMDIQKSVIAKYGFEANQQGVMMFAMAIQAHSYDPEISALSNDLKAKFMPNMQAMAMMQKPL